MAFYQVAILIFYICYTIEYSHTINEEQVELFRQSCPYTNFCSSNSSVALERTDRTPCCMDCFCDSACFNYGDCCPDLLIDGPKGDYAHVPVCKEVMYQNEYAQTGTYFISEPPMYRVIDQCPSEYSDGEMTKEKCAENYTDPTTYDDIVMVSADDFRLFQNKHCARCHGVIKTTRWDLIVTYCRENLEDTNMVASEAQAYIMKNCILWSSRPATVPLNGRTMDCRLRSTCSDTGDENIKEACVNGPFMPYSSETILMKSWFRNVMCFKCAFGNQFEVSNKCRQEDIGRGKTTIRGLHMLLNLRQEDTGVTIKSSLKCGEAETYDQYSDDCRRMYCPPFLVAHYGRCVPISKQIFNFYVGLNILFTPEDTDLALSHDRIYPYNVHIKQFYLDRIREKVNLKNCHISAYSVEITSNPSSYRVEFLTVSLNIHIDENCSLEYLGNHIQNVQAAIRLTWLINNDTVPMKGRYYFGLVEDGNVYNKYIILYKTDSFMKSYIVDRFFVCPYFSLSVAEYNERVANTVSKAIAIKRISVMTTLEKGYYAVSETAIAVCVPAKSGGQNYESRFVGIILILLGFL